jgi:hypothetical protein
MALLRDLVGRAAIRNDNGTDSNPAAPSADGTRVDYQNAAERDRIEQRLQLRQLEQKRKT